MEPSKAVVGDSDGNTVFDDLMDATFVGADALSGKAFPFLKPSHFPNLLGYFGEMPIRRYLNSGATSFVFEGFDVQLNRAVVLKIMRPELAKKPDHRKRFLREARAAASLQSDYTVPIHQVGESEGLPFIEMAMMKGETLQSQLEREGKLSTVDALEIARQIVLGLRDAHNRGLIHRDIKPANIWMEPDPAQQWDLKRVRILDFGLACDQYGSSNSSITDAGSVIGTPHYMSPEQAQAMPLDHRSDFFSLGIVLYAMLSGKLPFSGTNVTSVLMLLSTAPHKPLAKTAPHVPGDVARFVDSLLEKLPGDRPASAQPILETLAELQAVHGESPAFVSQDPVSPSQRSRRAGESDRVEFSARPTPPNILPATRTIVSPFAPSPPPARTWRFWAIIFAATNVLLIAAIAGISAVRPSRPIATAPSEETIPVGLLFARSGTMAISEQPVEFATLLAIDEVNASGGLGGRRVVPVSGTEIDSMPLSYAAACDRAASSNGVRAFFGCWTSASRKAVLPRLQQHDSLLFYPVQYEGLESSEHVVYLGPTANQQLFPSLDFLQAKLGAKSIYLVGSDYVFPRAANEVIRDEIQFERRGAIRIAGEAYRALGDKNWTEAVADILRTKPDAIINTINGSSAFGFYESLRSEERRLGTVPIPILSVSVTENELRLLDATLVAGDYLAGSFFTAVATERGRAFSETIRKRSEGRIRATDMMMASYSGVHLWANAVRKAGSTEPSVVSKAVLGTSFDSPTGPVTVDAKNRHLWQPIRVAKAVQKTNPGPIEFDIVHAIEEGVIPKPYPKTRSREDWERFLGKLYRDWDGQWNAPAVR